MVGRVKGHWKNVNIQLKPTQPNTESNFPQLETSQQLHRVKRNGTAHPQPLTCAIVSQTLYIYTHLFINKMHKFLVILKRKDRQQTTERARSCFNTSGTFTIMARGFVTLLLLYSLALLFPPSFVPRFLSSLIFLPPATQAITHETTCMQQMGIASHIALALCQVITHRARQVQTSTGAWPCKQCNNRWALEQQVLASRLYELHLHARLLCTNILVRVSLQPPGQTLWVHWSRAGSASAHREPSVLLLLLLLPPSDQRTAWVLQFQPQHKTPVSGFIPEQPCHGRGAFCSHFK